MRKENSVVRTKFISEAGSQLVNADYFAFVELDNYACYCIADGIDNDRMKESAKMAVTAVIDEFYQRPGMKKGILRHYLETAHKTLLKESGTVRLEASILVIVTDYKNTVCKCWKCKNVLLEKRKDIKPKQRSVSESEPG